MAQCRGGSESQDDVHTLTHRPEELSWNLRTYIPPTLALGALAKPLLSLLRLDPLSRRLLHPVLLLPRSGLPTRGRRYGHLPRVALVVGALVRELGLVELKKDEWELDETLLDGAANSVGVRGGRVSAGLGLGRSRGGKAAGRTG